MPEGPSIVILKEEVQQFSGKKIIAVSGNSKIEQDRLVNQKVVSFESWGKHFLICFEDFVVRVHFLMFGSYRINDTKSRPARLSLTFKNGELNLYSCAIRLLEAPVDFHYDWSIDVMNDEWDAAAARKKLKSMPGTMMCDALLDQDIFAGVGNIIKNEVLYRVGVHPESLAGKLPTAKMKKVVDEARHYSFQFLEWKKKYELKKHWLAHTKRTCQRCQLPIIKKHTGFRKRRSFFCIGCQKLFT